MSKTFKMSILLIIITLGFLFLGQTQVSAVYIDSVESLEETFNGTATTINGTTITLNGDVTIDDAIEIVDGEYVLDLNGYTLTVIEFYVMDGKLTINDATGKGEFVSGWTSIGSEEEPTGELIINNGKYEFIDNYGKLTINNGTIENLSNCGDLTINNGTMTNVFNIGTLTIEDGTFNKLAQGGTATINGGKFIAKKVFFEDAEEPYEFFSEFDLSCKTTMTGGEFILEGDATRTIALIGPSEISANDINKLVGEGFEASFDSDEFYVDEDIAYYGEVKIIKDKSVEIFEKIAPNGVWTVNSFKPDNPMDGQHLLTALVKDCVDSSVVKDARAWYDTKPEEATIILVLNGSGSQKERNVKVVYNEPDTTSNTKVNEVLGKMKKLELDNVNAKTSYRVEDLYLINYLDASSKGLDGSMALNFSKELIEETNGSNISFRIITGAGGGNSDGLYTYAKGQAVIYHDNTVYDTLYAGVNMNHLLYIPSDTANTSEAYIAAAMKRIKDYLGTTDGIKIELGETFESLNYYDQYADRIITWNENEFIDETTSGSNYYNLTMNGKTYKFAICKKDASKLETPKYIGSDIKSNISITSEATEIPLDTTITVEKVASDDIEKTLGTNVYTAYDITLYSDAKEENIKKLKNGKFIVSIPVPENLKDKEITVCYINNEGEKEEEHVTTVEDGIASFETDHFSTYALIEKVAETPKEEDKEEDKNKENEKNEENKGDKDTSPDTGTTDIIEYVLVLTIISALGIVIVKRNK